MRTVTALLVLAFGVVTRTASAQGVDVRVTSAIVNWENLTRIDVADVPERDLPKVVPSIISQLGWHSKASSPANYEDFVTKTVTESFLYFSRDQSAPNAVRLGETTVTPERITAFLRQHDTIKNREVGRLHVTSDPTQGDIEIDQVAKGRTENAFVVSVGNHVVLVKTQAKTCNKPVDVAAGKTVEVDCR